MEELLNNSDVIKAICADSAQRLLNASQTGPITIQEHIINCCDLLDEYKNIDVRASDKYKSLFAEVGKMKGPVLYWFEILSDHNSEIIVQALKEYQLQADSKAIPAIKSRLSEKNILYVGKVKNKFWGRLIQHMGYYKVARTQGLQLFYWAKKLDIRLKLVAYEFPLELADLMAVLENEMARKLQPVIGKHI